LRNTITFTSVQLGKAFFQGICDAVVQFDHGSVLVGSNRTTLKVSIQIFLRGINEKLS
jgi:hypothetical protein